MTNILAVTIVALTISTSAILAAISAPSKTDYPHWNFDDAESYQKLERIHTFIQKNKGKDTLAVFDWDGTLYDEHIPVKELDNNQYAGQPAFYIWAANHPALLDFKVFPMFWTQDDAFKENVLLRDKYLEGRLNAKPDPYSIFIQTTLFTAGMSPEELSAAINQYLLAYPPEQHAFLPMLDVVQMMLNENIDTWIVTGSNQYFVGPVLEYIQKNIDYRADEKYDFSKILASTQHSPMHIAGNGMKLMKNNRFSVVYDDRYTQNSENKLYIVDHEGKEIVVKNLEKWEHATARFVAGNSDGDFNDTRFVINKDADTFAISVNPAPESKLRAFAKAHPEQVVILDADEI